VLGRGDIAVQTVEHRRLEPNVAARSHGASSDRGDGIDQANPIQGDPVMKSTWSNTPGRLVVIGAVLALVAAIAGSGVAFATPAGGASATSVVLADGTFVNTVNTNLGPTKLRTKDEVEVFQVSNTANSSWTSGWHEHTGPVLVNITAGSLTFYAADCTRTVVAAGHGYIETPGEPILARNEGSVQAAWITTQIIPVGASRRIDKATAICGVQ